LEYDLSLHQFKVFMSINEFIVIPWGRIAPIRKDYEQSVKTVAEGGTRVREKFWRWSEEQVKPYL